MNRVARTKVAVFPIDERRSRRSGLAIVRGRAIRGLAGVVRLPDERGRLPAALLVLIQTLALVALITVVRDYRPDPRTDPAQWQQMGLFAEFTSIAPLAVVFIVVATAGLHALDSDMSEAARANECRIILNAFALAVVVVLAQLVSYGLWKGIWEMFGMMAGIAGADLALVFLVFRYLDVEGVTEQVTQAAPTRR